MIWITYFSGVIVMLILGLLHLRNKSSIYLSDLLTVIVFSILSWTSLVFAGFNRLCDWMINKDHDKLLWHNNKD